MLKHDISLNENYQLLKMNYLCDLKTFFHDVIYDVNHYIILNELLNDKNSQEYNAINGIFRENIMF